MSLAVARRKLTRVRSPFALPNIAPGFNPLHPAAQSVRFSGTVFNGNFVDLLTGKAGTYGGAPTFGVKGLIGPAMRFAQGSSDNIQFPGKPALAFTGYTLACIVFIEQNLAGTEFMLCTGTSSSGGVNIADVSGAINASVSGATGFASTIAPATGGSYFIAISITVAPSIKAIVVVANLQNGQIQAQSTIAGVSTPGADPGICTVGNRGAGAFASPVSMARAMYSTNACSTETLVQWAADPWSFWYPGK